jgi:hypothetical protein
MKTTSAMDRKLQERLLAGRRVEGDRLVLADAVLEAALDGRRPLTANERAALRASPLTARRLRQLSIDRHERASQAPWQGSAGMLRAADSGAGLDVLATDDGAFRLHFVPGETGWRVILQLAPDASCAARLLRERPLLRVLDGAGAAVLEGRLDTDCECEDAWPFVEAPAAHFQRAGAAFSVVPAGA